MEVILTADEDKG